MLVNDLPTSNILHAQPALNAVADPPPSPYFLHLVSIPSILYLSDFTRNFEALGDVRFMTTPRYPCTIQSCSL